MTNTADMIDPITLLRPRRTITGMSAILLPFLESGAVDWHGFEAHVDRTLDAGLTPAVNMDTGYANLIDETTRTQALDRTQAIARGRDFVAGVYTGDAPGVKFDAQAYQPGAEAILTRRGTPVIFQSYGLGSLDESAIAEAYAQIAAFCPRFIGFELGNMFAPFGRIYTLETYEQLMSIPECLGAKHSSLSRELEWQRLILRDRVRPDFKVFTGNDLAIDMVMYGSDYLLGLSTFAPDYFAQRDALWAAGDPAFYELNDTLQYLGFLAFRDPVPAYKHSAAMFLNLRGWIATDQTHPESQSRPSSDRAILQVILEALTALGGA